MNIFKKLFGQKRPTLSKNDISNFEKIVKFLSWYIKNEPICNSLNNRTNHMIYNEGIRPLLDINTIPEITDLENILEWFSVKFFYDIKKIKDSNKVEYKQFIDELVALSYVTLSTVGNIGIKYNVDFRNSVYEEEIKKIPAGSERETFKANFITDCVLGAEIRIMAWLYHDYFDEWFKPEKLKYE